MAKYYQDNKERLQKKACERYQNLSKEGKKTSDNMILNDTKSIRRCETKTGWVQKNIIKWEKTPY